MFRNKMDILQKKMTATKKFMLFTVGLIGGYWTTTRFHAGYCAPSGIWGLLQTPVLMGSPLCLAATEVLSKTSQVYVATWIGVVGSGIAWMWDICSSVGGRIQCKSKE